MNRASLFVPLGVFAVLAVLFWVGLGRDDPHKLPSALLDKAFPAFSLPLLQTAQQSPVPASPAVRADHTKLRGEVHLVNVWATWCPTCKAEHAELMKISQTEKIAIVGVDYKDDAGDAVQWIARFGNPYVWTVVDAEGTLGVDLGVYGAPETFLVDRKGIIRYKWVGDVNERVWTSELKPRVLALQREAS